MLFDFNFGFGLWFWLIALAALPFGSFSFGNQLLPLVVVVAEIECE